MILDLNDMPSEKGQNLIEKVQRRELEQEIEIQRELHDNAVNIARLVVGDYLERHRLHGTLYEQEEKK